MSRTAAMLAAVAVVVGLGSAAWVAFAPGDGDDRFAECRAVKVAGSALIGGPFTLTAQDGSRVTDAQVIDGPSLLYFGYTFCPDVCPVDTSRNVDAIDILTDRGVDVKPVFITIDPLRDDVAAMRDFVGNLSPKMVGLTGTEDEIAAVAKAYRVYRAKQGDDAQDYLMDHTTYAYLMAPDEGMLEIFRRDDSAEEVARRTECFVDKL
ncbi:MAG: protein SCO1/2 [Paracoccaceae bacterium]|jgi:protein SCO1/2